jgi:DNA ligase (NAD+)
MEKVTLDEAKKRALNLRREIEEHNYRYHVLDQPLVDDFKFDQLMRELTELEELYPEI